MSDRSGADGILAFLVGGVVGAALGVILAPRKGSETREMLGDWLEESGDKAKGIVTEGRDSLKHKKDQIEAAWEAGKKAYRGEPGA